jgi:hypothetical protein
LRRAWSRAARERFGEVAYVEYVVGLTSIAEVGMWQGQLDHGTFRDTAGIKSVGNGFTDETYQSRPPDFAILPPQFYAGRDRAKPRRHIVQQF